MGCLRQHTAANPGTDKWDGAYLKKAVPNDPWAIPINTAVLENMAK
jgi:hypothetical protein